MVWFQFLACVLVIVYAGSKLAIFGDQIGDITGVGKAWVGLMLIASITSLPELVTGLSSVVIHDLPDIAVGDVLGSCMFNLLIIAFLDMASGRVPLSIRVHQGHTLAASFGIIALGFIAMGLAMRDRIPSLSWIGVTSAFGCIAYFFGTRSVYLYVRLRQAGALIEPAQDRSGLKRIYLLTAVHAVLIVGAGSFLPGIGESIAEITGLGQSFVGNAFIAISTSLPEIVVTLAAVRIGAYDMAIGNLFGSNMFNILILAIDDAAYLKGPILNHVSEGHLAAAMAAIIMSAVAIAGLTYRVSRKALFVHWDSASIIVIYVLGMWSVLVLGKA